MKLKELKEVVAMGGNTEIQITRVRSDGRITNSIMNWRDLSNGEYYEMEVESLHITQFVTFLTIKE